MFVWFSYWRKTLESVEKTGITACCMLQHLLCWDNFVFNGRTWVRVGKYIHENCLWSFVCFYTLLFLFMRVPTCDMHVEFKDNLGEFLLSSTVVPEV